MTKNIYYFGANGRWGTPDRYTRGQAIEKAKGEKKNLKFEISYLKQTIISDLESNISDKGGF